jgi:hypothetical protein
MSPAQLSLLERNLARAADTVATTDKPRARRPRAWLPENLIEKQIVDFLAWRGFISVRQHVGTFVPLPVARQLQAGRMTLEQALRNVVRIGEEGAADWWSARPIIPPGARALDGPWPWQGFYWEAKAPNKRPSAAQLEWLNRRRQVGLAAGWFDQFSAQDRPSSECEPRNSHVFETWFFGYFSKTGRNGHAA